MMLASTIASDNDEHAIYLHVLFMSLLHYYALRFFYLYAALLLRMHRSDV